MSNDPRSEQFAGFAKAVVEKLYEQGGEWWDIGNDNWREEWQEIIAHAAFDLVRHALYCDGLSPLAWGHASDIYEREVNKRLEAVPDLPELPEEKSE